MKSLISIQNVNAFYGDQQALKDINVEIPEKQITAIIGPSGCGKSTLLKCLNRLIDLTDGAKVSGKIIVDGINVLNAASISRMSGARWDCFHRNLILFQCRYTTMLHMVQGYMK